MLRIESCAASPRENSSPSDNASTVDNHCQVAAQCRLAPRLRHRSIPRAWSRQSRSQQAIVQLSNITIFRPSACLEALAFPFLTLKPLLQANGSWVEPRTSHERTNAFLDIDVAAQLPVLSFELTDARLFDHDELKERHWSAGSRDAANLPQHLSASPWRRLKTARPLPFIPRTLCHANTAAFAGTLRVCDGI